MKQSAPDVPVAPPASKAARTALREVQLTGPLDVTVPQSLPAVAAMRGQL